MTGQRAGARIVVLCEYWSPFAEEPVAERLQVWELAGPRYTLSVQQFASPDGDSDEAWLSAEVGDVAALWRQLEDWSTTRRIDAQTLSVARNALADAYPAGARPSIGRPSGPGDVPSAAEPAACVADAEPVREAAPARRAPRRAGN